MNTTDKIVFVLEAIELEFGSNLKDTKKDAIKWIPTMMIAVNTYAAFISHRLLVKLGFFTGIFSLLTISYLYYAEFKFALQH